MLAALLLKLILTNPQDNDARATECQVDDYACLEEHDRRVLDLAFLTRDASLCGEAVVRKVCLRDFRRFGGEF